MVIAQMLATPLSRSDLHLAVVNYFPVHSDFAMKQLCVHVFIWLLASVHYDMLLQANTSSVQ